jgi:hypothetical protein
MTLLVLLLLLPYVAHPAAPAGQLTSSYLICYILPIFHLDFNAKRPLSRESLPSKPDRGSSQQCRSEASIHCTVG